MHHVSTDILVIGAGIAGLSTALASRGHTTILYKTSQPQGASFYAQGGIAAAIDAEDSPFLHAQDTEKLGCLLPHNRSLEAFTRDGRDQVRKLLNSNWQVDLDKDGQISLGREGGHQRRRIIHAQGDATGKSLSSFLYQNARQAKHIHLQPDCFVWDILCHHGEARGVLVWHKGVGWIIYHAQAVVLASGGCGWLFSRTTNPCEATGDGIALAKRAGASLMDLEFIQFHPTAFDHNRDEDQDTSQPVALLTEALRGEGAKIVTENRQQIMTDHPLKDLAPRDIVARTIWQYLEKRQKIFLDVSTIQNLAKKFPRFYELITQNHLDPAHDLIPIAPAAHYMIGGVAVDENDASTIGRLYAVGETAASTIHGANRLASNSLLEGLVYGHNLGKRLSALCDQRQQKKIPTPMLGHMLDHLPYELPCPTEIQKLTQRLRQIMYQHAGLIREEGAMKSGIKKLSALAQKASQLNFQTSYMCDENLLYWGELRNMLEIAPEILNAALARKESRGTHYRSDYPYTDPAYQKHFVRNFLPASLSHSDVA